MDAMKPVRMTVAEFNDVLEALAVRRAGVEQERERLLLEGESVDSLSARRLEGRVLRLRTLEARLSAAREADG